MTRGARRRPSASRTPADFPRADIRTDDRRRRVSSRASTLRAPHGAMPIELHLAGGHNVLNALAPPRPRTRRRRDARRRARGPCHNAPGSLADCSSKPRRVAPGSSTTPTTPTRVRCGRDRRAGERRRAALAGARRHGRARRPPTRSHARDRPLRARAPASTGCSPSASCRALAVEAFGAGARVVRRHRGAGARGQCRAHARGVRAGQGLARRTGWSAWSRRWSARRRIDEDALNACCTGSPNC